MADISTYLNQILAATYGEEVRGSIHDAIDIINKVGEKVLNLGTAVDSPTSSSTGFYLNSLYLNTTTFELWKNTGTNAWQSQGVLKGANGNDGADGNDGNGIVSIAKTGTSGLIDTYTITFSDGTTTTYQVANGADGDNGNKWYRGTGVTGTSTNPTKFTGSGVTYAFVGDNYLNTSTGGVYHCATEGNPNTALWVYDFQMSGGGSSVTVVDNLTTQSSADALSANQGYVLKGLVDEKASTSDVTTSLAGKVDKVTGKGLSKNDYTDADKAIVDGVTSALAGKADSATTLAGYGITDAYTKTEVDTALGVQIEGNISGSTITFTNSVCIGGTDDYLLDPYCSDLGRSISSVSISGHTLTVTLDSAPASGSIAYCIATKVR